MIPYIISRYIDRPLLIDEKKFDLRIYVLVTCFNPLRAYRHREGFARFCATGYCGPNEVLDLRAASLGSHLTNVSYQKNTTEYNEAHGGKLAIGSLRLYLESVFGFEKTARLFAAIDFVIWETLSSVRNVIVNDKHCFELYGYDILIDDAMRPWLMEVNASPSLSVTTRSDGLLKDEVLKDLFALALPPKYPRGQITYSEWRTRPDAEKVLGGFQPLHKD